MLPLGNPPLSSGRGPQLGSGLTLASQEQQRVAELLGLGSSVPRVRPHTLLEVAHLVREAVQGADPVEVVEPLAGHRSRHLRPDPIGRVPTREVEEGAPAGVLQRARPGVVDVLRGQVERHHPGVHVEVGAGRSRPGQPLRQPRAGAPQRTEVRHLPVVRPDEAGYDVLAGETRPRRKIHAHGAGRIRVGRDRFAGVGSGPRQLHRRPPGERSADGSQLLPGTVGAPLRVDDRRGIEAEELSRRGGGLLAGHVLGAWIGAEVLDRQGDLGIVAGSRVEDVAPVHGREGPVRHRQDGPGGAVLVVVLGDRCAAGPQGAEQVREPLELLDGIERHDDAGQPVGRGRPVDVRVLRGQAPRGLQEATFVP